MSEENGSGVPENALDATATATKTKPDPAAKPADEWGAEEWRKFADEVGVSPEKLRERLGHARTWEKRAKENGDAAAKAGEVEKELEKLRSEMAKRDKRDLERAGKTAMTQLRASLAEVGVRPGDVSDLLDEIVPSRLLKDGEPDDEAVARVTRALARTAGRATPDPDQGRASNGVPQGMGGFLRELRATR